MSSQPTEIARVAEVRGALVRAELLAGVAGTTPQYRGRIYRVGQVGSIVRIPVGPTDLLGSVITLAIADGPIIRRWLDIQLLGEVDALGVFRRGVSTYPSLDDPVHFATDDVYSRIFPPPTQLQVPIGRLASSSASHPVTLDLARLVLRHSAVLGSTGSGKTSAVASLIQTIAAGGLGRANIVIIDPHGEYVAALGDLAEVRSVTADGGLRVPYWALGLDDLLRVFAAPGLVEPIARNAISDLVREEREKFLRALDDPWFPPEAVTADTPTPFDMRKVWFELDKRNRATYSEKPGEPPQVPLVDEEGDAATLKPTRFRPYNTSNLPPHRGLLYGHFGSVPGRILARLADPRFRFLSATHPEGTDDQLPSLMAEWLGGSRPVSILDFAGIPSGVADVAIGVVLSLLFEAAVHSPLDSGIGRARPVLIVLEEAHRFIGPTVASPLAQSAVERIAREGRKHGVGLMLVSQRPGELSPTAVAQCGTIVSLRLTNPGDQGVVRAALPDTLAGLADLLPSLRTGEGLIAGEAIALPARVAIRRPSPEPRASDPSLESWIGEPAVNELGVAVKRWRGRLRGDT